MNECPSSWPRVCNCSCHMQLNNVGCNQCSCKPVHGDLNEKIKFLEQTINNAIRRIANAQTDIKELMLRVSKLEK